MNQRQLEIFTLLAENLNFTRTAEQLYLSQTTVTLQIRSLEEELNAKLFERTSRKVKLTPAGSLFYEDAKEILSAMQRAAVRTSDAARGYNAMLRIGYADEAGGTGVSGVIRSFSLDYPRIRLQIEGGYPSELLNRLMAEKYDLVFAPSFRRLRDGKLMDFLIGNYRPVVVFHKDHRFFRKKKIKYEDFAGEDYIAISGTDEELDFTGEFMRQLENHNVHINLFARTDNIDSVFLTIQAGLAITVIPEYFRDRLSGSANLRMTAIDEELPPTEFLAVWKPGRQSKELLLFIDYMKKMI